MRDEERPGEETPAEPQPYEAPAIDDLKATDAPLETAPGTIRQSQHD
jgi:hypothetical protein